jgi:hypothetical protein
MKHLVFALSLGLFACGTAWAQDVPARLLRLDVLPAASTVAPPSSAPDYFEMTGRFAALEGSQAGARTEVLGARAVGGVASLPALDQAVQGVSAILRERNGFWALSDNGFGTRRNSADAMLMIHRFAVEPDGVARQTTVFLSDPARVVPFAIVAETHPRRHLTGADFDPESFAPRDGGGFWVGDEFGPYLLEFDARGRLLALFDLPDPSFRAPENWRGEAGGRIGRSRGLEGMAHSADRRFLYPTLEAPIQVDGQMERLDGQAVARIFEFDTQARAFTDRVWFYPLADDAHAIGDITMIGPSTALVIERDGGHGAQAAYKKLQQITLPTGGGMVQRGPSVDLLAIADPDGVAGARGGNGMYRMPFVTIESVAALPNGQVLVINDNNFPASGARGNPTPDDTEIAVISAPGLFDGVTPGSR